MAVLISACDNGEVGCLSPSGWGSSPAGALHRMVPGSGNGPSALQYMGPTYSRFFHHHLRFLLPSRPSRLMEQCPPGRFIRGPAVHVPSSDPPTPCTPQGGVGGGLGHCDSSMVTPKGLVFSGPTAPGGPSSNAGKSQ